jgi:hypothetical protein
MAARVRDAVKGLIIVQKVVRQKFLDRQNGNSLKSRSHFATGALSINRQI